jgi:hypothetical protein
MNAQGQPIRRVEGLRSERREEREGDRTIIREPDRVIVREGGRTIIRQKPTASATAPAISASSDAAARISQSSSVPAACASSR